MRYVSSVPGLILGLALSASVVPGRSAARLHTRPEKLLGFSAGEEVAAAIGEGQSLGEDSD